jgi:hypothetical protein
MIRVPSGRLVSAVGFVMTTVTAAVDTILGTFFHIPTFQVEKAVGATGLALMVGGWWLHRQAEVPADLDAELPPTDGAEVPGGTSAPGDAELPPAPVVPRLSTPAAVR